jgi:hypothetical protein
VVGKTWWLLAENPTILLYFQGLSGLVSTQWTKLENKFQVADVLGSSVM